MTKKFSNDISRKFNLRDIFQFIVYPLYDCHSFQYKLVRHTHKRSQLKIYKNKRTAYKITYRQLFVVDRGIEPLCQD